MRRRLGLLAIALLLVLLVLFLLIPSEDPSLDDESVRPSANKQTNKKYYSLSEIAQMKVDTSKDSTQLDQVEVLNEAEIFTILQSNTVCDLKGKLQPLRNNIRSGLDVFFQLSSPVRADTEATQLIGPLFSGPFQGNQSLDDILPAVKFFNALLFAGMVTGVDSKDVDYPEALQLLQRLEASDSLNAAYPLFHAAILHKTNAPPEDVRAMLAQALSRPHFDTFERRITEAIYRQSFASVMAFFYAEALLHSMPVVDWSPVSSLFKEHLGKDAELDRAAIAFGKRLRTQGERTDGEFEFILWSALEYEYGNFIQQLAWKNAFPGKPEPVYKRSQEIRKTHEDLEDLNGQMDAILRKGAPCDPKVFQDIYSWNRKAFEKTLDRLRQ